MKSWFWPGVTWTATLTALALWFGVDRIQTDISTRTSEALAPFVWTGFDIEGRDVTVKGIAPDPAAQEAARAALQAVWGINDITDLTSVLPATSPYIFNIEKNSDGLVFSGSIPENALRDRIMEAAEDIAPGSSLDDEMALARGSWPDFSDGVLFALTLTKGLADGAITLTDRSLSIKGKAASAEEYQAMVDMLAKPLPFGLKLAASDVAQP
ncbi:BON domain-containing protein [Ochrobactrum sp. RH2CCR150]|uniref:BON domain-containing protein n=1 Tax=Ochrobactrum sp. RH2CCR150 TaxID=2587044 RepID=UPI0015FC457A|nr:OOP family OmpA-OmpF porin [Ochrobactrum sp. RH2CCR150]